MYSNHFFNQSHNTAKNDKNYKLAIRWINMLHGKRSLNTVIETNKYRKVAIYGMGLLGNLVYNELRENANLKELYGIDKGNPNLPEGVPCFRLYEITEHMKPDVIIVTVLWDFDNIESELKAYFEADICSLESLLEEAERTVI